MVGIAVVGIDVVGATVSGSILHGGGLLSQLNPAFLMVPKQQLAPPPGLVVHPPPPHVPHDAEQHTSPAGIPN